MLDHTCGYCSLLPNLLKGFGWNPGKRMLKWFGEQLKERTGDSDITFKEVCGIVVNYSQILAALRTPHYYRQFALFLGKESPY